MFGRATAAGASIMWATGAYGSNHAVATVLHAPAAGLASGAILFPQPASEPARANLSALLSARPEVDHLATVAALPFAMRRIARDRRAYVMTPGGATPEGAFGAMSAGVELGEQVARGACPPPARIVIPAGSTCSSAGLLAGLRVAAALGLGFTPQTIPLLTVVRVTPWPITAPLRIARLAQRALLELAKHWPAARRLADLGLLRAGVEVDGDQLRGGYGRITARGERASLLFARCGAPVVDVVYSAKSAAALCELAPTTRGPVMFWATKSSAPLPVASAAELAAAARPLRARLGYLDSSAASS
jgi:1-aminocyclopropane-1-carboxylate deaminase/D-cysteine desulfhydrase-like pyridoxal-dependent ACC family enzyme